MPLADSVLDDAADGAVATLAFAQIHTADPEPSGANESTATRQAITWNAATGTIASANATLAFTGGASSGPATYMGFWTLASGGTFLGSRAMTGDQTFNAAGEYNITSLDVDADNG